MKHASKEELIAFEQETAQLWENGDLPYLIHLSGGNEDFLIDLFGEANEGGRVSPEKHGTDNETDREKQINQKILITP